jgi:predicted metal-binding membrane protein
MLASAYNLLQLDNNHTPFERLLRRDRTIVSIALLILILLAWFYVVRLGSSLQVSGIDLTGKRMVSAGTAMMHTSILQPWSSAEFAFMFIMWAAMTVAMMLPSATPMVLRYARIGRAAAFDTNPIGVSGWFVAGYLLVWFGFAFAATDVQWALERTALLTPTGSTSNAVGGILLIIAGLYQWSPLKGLCLAHCQDTPLFLHSHGGFRHDVFGALKIGVLHGTLCVGCCWVLMTLLFVGGVTNVFSMAVIATLVLAQKNCQRAFLVAHSRRWSNRRRLVADAAYVLCRSCADSRCGAHAVPWMDRGIAPAFWFFH